MPERPKSMIGRMIVPLIFGAAGVAILISLGLWQLQRLAWKTAIIERIEARLEAAPVAVPAAPDPGADRYLRVRADGTLGAQEVHVYTSAPPRGVGYRVIAPLNLTDGRRILLDRGFVPIDDKDTPRHAGPIVVEGALDWPRETDGFTSAPDLDKNIWFARDVALMSEALGTLPILLVTEASDVAGAPTPLPVSVDIRNDHLEYAITWFSLAFVWMMMTLYLLWRIKRRID